MDPEAQDPGTHHPPSRGPTEPRGPGPGKQPKGVSQHTPKHPAPDTENHKYTSEQRLQPPAGGVAGRKLIQEREQSKTQPVANKQKKKKKKKQAHSHNHPLPPSCIHIKSLTPNVRMNNNGRHTLTHTPHAYSILPGPGATSPRTQEVVPFPPGAEAGRQRRYCPDPGDPGP
ncbi:hypothetical protein CHARACLAT_033124, partial [Characodon lateralis]|nr:hypothetical protein [Characodon lateralis]